MSGVIIENGRVWRIGLAAPSGHTLSMGQWIRPTVANSTGVTEIIMGAYDSSFQGAVAAVASTGDLAISTVVGTTPTGVVLALDTYYYVGLAVNDSSQNVYIWDETGALLGSASRTDDLSGYGATQYLIGLGFGDGNLVGWQNRIWSAVLSPSEFVAERNSPTVVRTADLWGWYQYLPGAVLDDSSGNGRTMSDSYNYSEWGGVEPVLPTGTQANACLFGANF